MAVSLLDVQLLFAAIDCPPPTEKTLQRLQDKACEVYVEVNKQTMKENCEDIKSMNEITGEQKVVVATDTCYNNPPKGRSMYQPGTQSFSPMLHVDTGLVISCAAHNKLCSRGCDGYCEGCSANFEPHVSMDKSEGMAAIDNFTTVTENNLIITHILCDGTDKVLKGVESLSGETPEKLECVVHRARALRRKFYGCKFSVDLVGKPSLNTYSYNKAALANALVNRTSNELLRAVNKYAGDFPAYLRHMEAARRCIIPCFQGDHSECEVASLVCQGKCESSPVFLPHQKFISPTEADVIHLYDCIDQMLSPRYLWLCRYGYNTNRVEATHLRTLKLVAKTKLYKKNFNGRNHSAMHNASVGVGGSIQAANTRLGVSLQNWKTALFFKNLERRAEYLRNFKRTMRFRIARKLALRKHINLKKFSKLNIVSGPAVSDHTY